MPRMRRTYWLYPHLNSRDARRRARARRGLAAATSRYGNSAEVRQQREEMYEVDKDQANLVSSNIKGKPGFHAPVLDIDLPAALVPSSQKDHFHLYIDVEVPEEKYFALLDALADCKIIERGYASASKAKGGTFVRPPNVKKPWVEQANVREAELVNA